MLLWVLDNQVLAVVDGDDTLPNHLQLSLALCHETKYEIYKRRSGAPLFIESPFVAKKWMLINSPNVSLSEADVLGTLNMVLATTVTYREICEWSLKSV